jgi:hypothetical protein
LSEQHRQDDVTFIEVLAAVRRGRVTSEHRDLLSSRQAEFLDDTEHEGMTKLFSHNADVDKMNTFALSKIETMPRKFAMAAHGAPPMIEQLKRGCLSPETLVLKTGAWVMFTKNSPDGAYVNGTTGEIAGFSKITGNPIVQTRSGRQIEAEPTEWKIEVDGRTLATIQQIPLRLAWAMTVHKSQGMSLDAALIDLSSAFAFGQGYVALSRVRSFSGLHLRGLNERALQVDPVVLGEDAHFRDQSRQAQEWLASIAPDELTRRHEYFVLNQGGSTARGSSAPSGSRKRRGKEKRYEQTLSLIMSGKSIQQVAEERSRTVITIFEHLEELRNLGKLPLEDIGHLVAGMEEDMKLIQAVLKRQEHELLKPVFEKFQGEYSYDQIRLARLFLPKPRL